MSDELKSQIQAALADAGYAPRGNGAAPGPAAGPSPAAPAGTEEPPAWARTLMDQNRAQAERIARLEGNGQSAAPGSPPTFAEMLNGSAAVTGARPPAVASTGAAPRRVDDFRDEGGLIDVFALAPEQVLTMGPHRIREEFEKVLARQREMSGAPPLPSVLRNRR